MFPLVKQSISLINPRGSKSSFPDKLRDERLRALILHAAENCTYYRELFHDLSVRPEDIRTVSDLAMLPLLDREALQSRAGEIVKQGTDLQNSHVEKTTGTTGQPTLIYSSSAETWFKHAMWFAGYTRVGLRPWHRQAKLMMQLSMPDKPYSFQRFGLFRRRYLASSVPPAEKIRWIREMKPDVLFSWGSLLNEISYKLEETKSELHVPLIISSSDALMKDLVRQYIKGELVEVYGAMETGPIAWQCPTQDGYHVDPRWNIFDIVNDQGRSDRQGQIVCTPLWRYTMPLIRYQVGDLGEWETDPCDCGCPWPKIKKLQGRQADLLTLPNGDKVTASFLSELLYGIKGIKQFQLVQRTEKDNYLFIVPGPEYNDSTNSEIQARLCRKFGVQGSNHVRLVSSIFRPPEEKCRSVYTLSGVERMRRRGLDVNAFFGF